jgi:hypothetical protein
MDIAEVHGPFGDSDAANACVAINIEEPGRPPKPSDDSFHPAIARV